MMERWGGWWEETERLPAGPELEEEAVLATDKSSDDDEIGAGEDGEDSMNDEGGLDEAEIDPFKDKWEE